MPVGTQQRVVLKAANVQGHLQGLAQTQFRATLKTATGQPIVGEEVVFLTGATREEFGRGTTDGSGTAVCESGSQITNFQTVISSATAGYIALFEGTPEFQPAEAKGRISSNL